MTGGAVSRVGETQELIWLGASREGQDREKMVRQLLSPIVAAALGHKREGQRRSVGTIVGAVDVPSDGALFKLRD